MKRLIPLILLALLTFTTSASAEEIKINTDEANTVDMVYFYVNICESCTEAKEQIDLFVKEIYAADLKIGTRFITYNISYYSGYEYDTYLSYLDHYGLSAEGTSTPILFVGDTYYEGVGSIEQGLESLLSYIKDGTIPETPILDPHKDGTQTLIDTFNGFSGLKMLGIGLINGLNPCSLSMLLLLLSILMMKDVPFLKLSFTFLAGKFVSFVLIGSVLYNLLGVLNEGGFLYYTKLVIGLFVILLASLNLYDFFMTRKEAYGKVKNQLPSGVRRMNHRIIEALTDSEAHGWLFISMFLLGVIIAAGEFLCTGQIYMITINYMIQSSPSLSMTAILYLIVYSFGFILPPMVAVTVIAKTDELFNVSEFIREKMPVIKLITAILLVILGFVTIFY